MKSDEFVEYYGYVIPKAHATRPLMSANACPFCGRSGRWRSGVGFEHEKICLHHSPSMIWCPEDIRAARHAAAAELAGQGGDGI